MLERWWEAWAWGVKNSFASGQIAGEGAFIGGLVGANVEGTIANSYANLGIVSSNGQNAIGGLVGEVSASCSPGG